MQLRVSPCFPPSFPPSQSTLGERSEGSSPQATMHFQLEARSGGNKDRGSNHFTSSFQIHTQCLKILLILMISLLVINQIKSNLILLVTYTWLADVIVSVANCLCF